MTRLLATNISAFLNAMVLLGAQTVGAATVDKRAPADAQGEVEIGNVSGDVQVIGWDRAEVQVEADLGAGVERLDFRRDGRRTIVKVVLPAGRTLSPASDLIVHVPRASAVSVNTVSADQTLREIRGAQRLQAVSGTIVTEVWSGEFEAKTVSGEITVRGHGGSFPARVTSVSGDVRLAGMGSDIDLNTVSGDMTLTGEQLSRARIKTTNGDLELSMGLARGSRIDAESINGDLRFMFSGAVDAEFDVETFNGDIDNCFGHEARRTREFGPGNELRFRHGEGGGQIRVKTLNGDVEICRK